MRSIGAKNKNLVKKITKKVLQENEHDGYVMDIVREQLPPALWDTWESADAEINRIISDAIFEYRHSITI